MVAKGFALLDTSGRVYAIAVAEREGKLECSYTDIPSTLPFNSS